MRVPQDVALIGYDDTAYSAAPQNAVTSVDQSGELLGVQATRFLLERINGRSEPKHFVVTPRIVQRDSSRRRV
ncbi:MAG: substrate-binding domain-containing protein [Devosia sp.]|uniref:substrate-binding domain-containing protein n=1 Tax=Devosia sp. TaxID=1871048 RepID=UPI0033939236